MNFLFLETPSNLTIYINDLDTRKKLVSSKKIFDCSDYCLRKNLKIDSQNKKCVDSCNECTFKYEYNNICYNDCPNNAYTVLNEYLCLDKQPDGFYFDSFISKYKKCFDRCKSCYGNGNEENNNYIECKYNYLHPNGTI